MSYYTEKSFLVPVAEGAHLDSASLAAFLKQPQFIQHMLKEMGFAQTKKVKIDELRAVYKKLTRETLLTPIMPVLEAMADSTGLVDVEQLESFLTATAGLDVPPLLIYHYIVGT